MSSGFVHSVADKSDLIAILDQDSRYRYLSPSYATVLGLSPKENEGKCANDFIHKEDKSRIENASENLSPQQQVELAPYRFRAADGSWRWIETILTNMLDNPAINGIVANSHDVTERIRHEGELKEMLERYHRVTKATNDIIWDWNLKTDNILWNSALQEVLGYQDVETEAQWWYDHIHPERQDEVVQRIHQYIDQGKENWSEEYRFECADGTYKVFYDRGYLIFDEHGEPVRMIGSMQDITERKQHEEKLKKLSLGCCQDHRCNHHDRCRRAYYLGQRFF
ncbi:MAG: PAS domain-containing protein [Balneolaceae bacterium]|nr:PAS domain-containing protein [Balneolaceae bacterium]